MNYEELYTALQPQEKALKDALSSLQKLSRAIGKETESGDLKSMLKDLSTMEETAANVSAVISEVKETVSGFDTETYFRDGDFAEQMIACCEKEGIDVKGSFPVYEMFPYRVKLDLGTQDVYLDRKRIQCVRPQSFVDLVKQGQEKLNRASFNPQKFAGELAKAYDLAILTTGSNPGTDMYLKRLYEFLAPMSRTQRDYDLQSYAFDLARLYNSREDTTKTGRHFQIGTSRKSTKAIRFLDWNGKEDYLSTIRYYD